MSDRVWFAIFRWLGWEYDPRTGEPLPDDKPYVADPKTSAMLLAYTRDINREFARANLFRPYMRDKHE
jgi:hypothetical protein